MPQTITITATLQAVSEAVQGFEDQWAHLPSELRTLLLLAMQELCVNIVKHGYAGAAGTIVLLVELDTAQLRVTVHDTAPNAFTMPDEIEAPDPLALPESGWGIFIIHQVFDQVQYERLPDGNCWRLQKALGTEP